MSKRRQSHCRQWGLARAQVFGNHDIACTQGLLGNTKWVWGPYRRWSRHSNENRDTLTITRFHGGTYQPSSEIEFGNQLWAFRMPIQPFGWPPCVFCILLPLIIGLFPYYCLSCSHFQFCILLSLHISPICMLIALDSSKIIIIYNYSFQINGESIRDCNTSPLQIKWK